MNACMQPDLEKGKSRVRLEGARHVRSHPAKASVGYRAPGDKRARSPGSCRRPGWRSRGHPGCLSCTTASHQVRARPPATGRGHPRNAPPARPLALASGHHQLVLHPRHEGRSRSTGRCCAAAERVDYEDPWQSPQVLFCSPSAQLQLGDAAHRHENHRISIPIPLPLYEVLEGKHVPLLWYRRRSWTSPACRLRKERTLECPLPGWQVAFIGALRLLGYRHARDRALTPGPSRRRGAWRRPDRLRPPGRRYLRDAGRALLLPGLLRRHGNTLLTTVVCTWDANWMRAWTSQSAGCAPSAPR